MDDGVGAEGGEGGGLRGGADDGVDFVREREREEVPDEVLGDFAAAAVDEGCWGGHFCVFGLGSWGLRGRWW